MTPTPDELGAAIASLNDVVAEVVAGLAIGDRPSKGWAYSAVETLARHTRALGFDPNLDVGALAGWDVEA